MIFKPSNSSDTILKTPSFLDFFGRKWIDFQHFSKILLINISITGLVDTIVGNFVEIHQALHETHMQTDIFVKTYFLRAGNPETDISIII